MRKKAVRALVLIPTVALAVVGTSGAIAKPAKPHAGAWQGTKVQLGYGLSFKVSRSRRRITKIVAGVLADCDTGESTTTTFAPDSLWTIRRGRFRGRHRERFGKVTAYFTFRGRFTSSTRAVGELRAESIVAGTRCDTGRLRWQAKARG